MKNLAENAKMKRFRRAYSQYGDEGNFFKGASQNFFWAGLNELPAHSTSFREAKGCGQAGGEACSRE